MMARRFAATRQTVPARVCIVTPAHLCSNPRVVKEADALHDAGMNVHVVFAQSDSHARRDFDADIVRARRWSWTAVEHATRRQHRGRWLVSTITQRVTQQLPSICWQYSRLAEYGESSVFGALARRASGHAADLYIGHYAEGLAAAAAAAQRNAARLAFDAEDFHTGEANPSAQITRIDFIQRRYLPRCVYITAASSGIAEALASTYNVPLPTTIHNTFPWSDRQRVDGLRRDRCDSTLSLYWYSQMIGLDRGIQDAIHALSLLRGEAHLHLRGAIEDHTKAALVALARARGVLTRVHFHPPVPPEELLSRAMEHDIGLALEQAVTRNRAICATNKLFLFMLAGLAIAASDVPGQAAILSANPGVGALYEPGNGPALARVLARWHDNPELLRRAKIASEEAARARWNWETEALRLRATVQNSLDVNSTRESIGPAQLLAQGT